VEHRRGSTAERQREPPTRGPYRTAVGPYLSLSSATTVVDVGDVLLVLGHDVNEREPMGKCLQANTLELELRLWRL
jgi:hypothetical protein